MLYDELYEEFLNWAVELGLEFPCTAEQFFARAREFAQGDGEVIDQLCRRGIGPDWQND